jgi:regulatory protein
VRIEDFKAGKRKVDPITVVLEAGHSFELDPEIIVRFGLRRGMDVDGALRARLESENEQLMARRRLVHYLSTRRKTTREAQLYLERAGFSPTAVEHAVSAARTLGLLDDSAFAAAYVRTQQKVARKGPRALEHELVSRGVSGTEAEAAIASQYPAERQRELARAAAARRLPALTKEGRTPAARRKLHDFLLRRGFEPDVCRDVLRELLGETDEENR